jgi:1-acyl-sn-glycerol-3-phosphate acyltransferase
MKRLIQKSYLYFGFFIFGLAMLTVFPLVGLAHVSLGKRRSELVKLWCMKFWASSFYTFGIWFVHRASIRAQQTWPEGPVILVANHNSLLDTPALYLMLRRFAMPLAKIELTRAPVFGHLCRWITLPVDRRSTESRLRAMSDMKDYLIRGGSLVIFPEGKTNKSDKVLQPFEPGAFRLSKETGVPLIPVAIFNSRYCLGGGSPMILRPGLVETRSGPVFDPAEFSDAQHLQRSVFQWFEDQQIGMPVT